jgi:hypothetical protein
VASGEKEKRSNLSSVISISEKSESERTLSKQKKAEVSKEMEVFADYW